MDYKFDTQYFAITEKSVLLLRNRFPYQEILPANIIQVELTKGSDVKRPMASIVFGLVFIATGIFLFQYFLGYTMSILAIQSRDARTYAYVVIAELFFLSFGAFSIYRALPIHPVIKFSLINGEAESLPVGEIIKNKKIEYLLQCLKAIIDSKKILIDRNLTFH